jgi:cellulose synthase/poly-beta-1,6-N-acetylglucosamine synthase-like glycosyltransferase
LAAVKEIQSDAPLALSFLVPVYNERHVVEASLRRLLKVQSPLLRSMQVIVVDDHSTDGSLTYRRSAWRGRVMSQMARRS